MGTDIHLFVERKRDGQWETADKWTVNEYDKLPCVHYKDAFYSDRNYKLFSILADVRNGYGFGGVPTGKGFTPIAKPRGIPDDICTELRETWIGDHSFSHLTLAEIMAYDWTQTTECCGVVTPHEFFRWQRFRSQDNPAPETYCGSRTGAGVTDIPVEEMEKLVADQIAAEGNNWGAFQAIEDALKAQGKLQTTVTWQVAYYQVAERFLGTVVPRLWRLGAPEDVRIVFGFDS